MKVGDIIEMTRMANFSLFERPLYAVVIETRSDKHLHNKLAILTGSYSVMGHDDPMVPGRHFYLPNALEPHLAYDLLSEDEIPDHVLAKAAEILLIGTSK